MIEEVLDKKGLTYYDSKSKKYIKDEISKTRKYCLVGSDTANTAGWYKVASGTITGYGNVNITFMVTSTHSNYFSGILELQIRSESTKISCKALNWHTRIGFDASDVICVIDDMTYTVYVNHKVYQYARTMFEIISEAGIKTSVTNIELHNSSTPETEVPVATVIATDSATVKMSELTNQVNQIKLTNEDLNEIYTDTFTMYYAVGEQNTVKNNPFGEGKAFALFVYRNANTYRVQEVTSHDGIKKIRYCNMNDNNTWSEWKTFAYGDEYLPLTGGKLIGTLNTQVMLPSEGSKYDIGGNTLPYLNAYVKTLALRMNTSGAGYGGLTATTAGTETTEGVSRLILGNNIKTGTVDNASGALRLFGSGAGQTNIYPSNNSDSNIYQYFPAKSGTLALESDITSQKGVANGLAELDENGKVPSSQLPSYVDDVIEFTNKKAFDPIGESGKIYVDLSTNLTYRWSGTNYVEISPSLALGDNESTAYRGDRGKIAYDHSQTTSGNPHGVTKSDVGLGNVDNTSDLNKPVSTAQQAALDDKLGKTENATSATKLQTARKIDGVSFDGASDITHYGVCEDGSGVLNKSVSCPGFTLVEGATIKVKFKYSQFVSGATSLNVNGTGAKTIKYQSKDFDGEDILKSGTVYEFVYDGTNYILVGELSIRYSRATDSTEGLVKIGYTQSDKNYPVELNDSGQMYVNVPWTDTDTKYTHPTTAGNKHIPSGGSSGQILRWSSNGTAVWGDDDNTDTLNTAGSSDTNKKIFLIGADTQAFDAVTCSHDTAYVDTDGHVYSNSKQVVNLSDTQALTNKTYNGYTLGDACAKGVDTSVTNNSNKLITSGAVYSAIQNISSSGDYLPLAGGKLTGDLTTQTVKPSSATTYDLGTTTNAYNRAYLNTIALRGTSGAATSYGGLIVDVNGTTETEGVTRLVLGNNVKNGTADNASGALKIYGSGSGQTNIYPSNNTDTNIYQYFPAKSGTLALVGEPIFTSKGVNGTAGYIAFAELKVTGTYVNRPIEFSLSSRGKSTTCYVNVLFKNSGANDPEIQSIICTGSDYGIFAYKSGTSTWLLYHTKSEAYDSVTVLTAGKPEQSVTISYPDAETTFLTQKPTENIVESKFGGYLPLLGGGTIEGDSLDMLRIKRTSANSAVIGFENSNGLLGYIGMSLNPDGGLRRILADASKGYAVLDELNMSTYVVPKTGGEFTGNITAKYVTGTWLQSSENNEYTAANLPTDDTFQICIQKSDGWIYKRKVSNILKDIGAVSKAGDTMTGTLNVVDLVPSSSLGANLGQSTKPFNNEYVKTIALRGGSSSQSYGAFNVNTVGTADTTGLVKLALGNSVASGKADNAKGTIEIYGSNTKKTIINPSDTTNDVTVTLPNKSGTLATLDDISTTSSSIGIKTYKAGTSSEGTTHTIKVTGTFYAESTRFYTQGLLRFTFATANTTSTSTYNYGQYVYLNKYIAGQDSNNWLPTNGTEATSLPGVTVTIDNTSGASGNVTQTLTFKVTCGTHGFVTLEYDPNVYSLS